MEKLYRYLLLFGLMIPVFIPIGSLALRVPDGQVMLFGISWHPHLDIYTSLAEFDGRWFLDDSGKMIHGSDGKPVKAEIGTFGIFLKNKAPYLFEIMRPGTARTLGADKYKWIRENVKSKWMKPNKIIMRPHTIMQGIFSCMNYDLNAKLNQSGIHKYLGKKNEYVLGWLRAAMNDFVGWLNGLEIKNKQAMDFNTLYYKIRESFIWWLCKMANTAKAYAGTNAYLELDDPINSNENKSGIVSSAVMVEFWSNHDNAGICEFWDATMAWFLCVLEESGVRNAKGISLIELVKEEFLWLVECVGLFLGNDQPSDEVMTNVVTEGCMVQLKNYCYLLYHYKKKIYDVLDSVSTYMKSDADLMRIKDLIGKLCKQWDGRNLEKIVLPLAAMDVKSINKFNKINEFLYDEDRNSTLNVEADLIALNDVLSDTYNNNEANAAAKETLLRAMDYTHDVIQVLCHIRNYSSWIKDNLETYCNEFASEQDQPEQKGLTEQEQSLPANMYPALKNMTLSGIDKCVYFPQN
ncbi:MAG: hypothetical protein LBH49_00630, partial [Puniceicoccales bacterium]|nr:hypothetical protein [Puniceicoccales bacterium]